MKIFGKNKQSGFSLVELMIVVGIIGVLATLALPRFKQFQSKAKLAEAANVLQHIYTLEQSYSLDNNQFITMPAYGANTGTPSGQNTCPAAGQAPANTLALGFVLEPCVVGAPTPRFAYRVDQVGGTNFFQATAATGGAAANRICTGNAAFSVILNQSNEPSYTSGNGNGTGPAPIGTVCRL
ncbi:MAG: type II secretion system protein [Bdellovibrionota bacterium]